MRDDEWRCGFDLYDHRQRTGRLPIREDELPKDVLRWLHGAEQSWG